MEVRQAFAAILLAAILLGCRSQDPSIDLLEGELRWMEDQLFMMEDELAVKCDELRRCRESDGRACGEVAGSRSNGGPSSSESKPIFPLLRGLRGRSTEPSPTPADRHDSPNRRHPANEGDSPVESGNDFSEPIIELPTMEQPADVDSSQSSTPPPTLDFDSARSRPVQDQRITHLVVSGHIDEGLERYNPRSAEGLLVIVEPRNADGRFVDRTAPVSVVILDAGQEDDEKARLARWDLDAIEAGKTMRVTGPQPGLHLQLPWPNGVPEHSGDLRVFVRYNTDRGQVIETDAWVSSQPPTAMAGQWLPIDGTEVVAIRRSQPRGDRDDRASDVQSASWMTEPIDQKDATGSHSNIHPVQDVEEVSQRPVWSPNR